MLYIVRYGEISLKGKNRSFFENTLVRNIKLCLKDNNIKVKKIRGRILVYSDNAEIIKNVFGIVSISKAEEVELDFDKIKEEALRLYDKGTFRITSKRLDKRFHLTSEELSRDVGAYIVKERNAKVKLKNADEEIFIEIFNDKAYLFKEKIRGLGGLPISCSGKVAILLENENSLLAAFLMMKRGCSIVFIGDEINVNKLKKYSYGTSLEIKKEIPEDVVAIVTGETIEEIKERDYDKTILRPLVGYDLEKIKELL